MKRMNFDRKFNGHRPLATAERGREDLKSGRSCFSFAAYARNVMEHLIKCGVPIASGLTDEEFSAVEGLFGFVFPPDLRSILEEGLPVGKGFPNWRSCTTRWEEEERVRMMMDLPMAALSYDVAMGQFWWKDWGPRPANTQRAFHIAAVGLSKVPTLLPIYSHCYVPSSPCLAGNPVLLLRRGDFCYCGYDVSDFFHRHPFIPHDISVSCQPRCTLSGHEIPPVLRNRFPDINDESRAKYSNGCRQIWELERRYLSGESTRTRDIISAFNFYQMSASANVSDRYTMKAPCWAAQSAQRIEFWSDLVEKKHTMNAALHSAGRRVRCQGSAVMNNSDTNGDSDSIINTKWVANYLKDIEQRLRNGGWKDEDIYDIINIRSSSSCDQPIRIGLRDQNVKEMLSLRLEMWSGCLRRGGWSDQDIVECIN